MDKYSKKEERPMISIICPTYNHEAYIRQAMDSILMQKTEFKYEILVGEDCSPDNSKDILEEYARKYPDLVKVYHRVTNMGATKNGYDLYMHSRGKYIALLELDDYWTDEYKIQKQVEFLEKHTDIIGCAHDSIMIDEKDQVIKETLTHGEEKELTLDDFLRDGFTFQSASLIYRNIFHDGNDYSILYKSHDIAGDIVVNSMLLLRGNIFLMKEKMSAYRRVIKVGGSSAASISHANEALSLINSMKQLEMLNDYFHGKIDYSLRMIYPMERYITGILKREQGFNVKDYIYMRKVATPTVKKEVKHYIMEYPIRKVRKVIGCNNDEK